MATSGSVDYSITSRQVIKHALLILRVLASGEDPSGDEADDALTALNLMLKTWGATGRLWLKTEGSTALVLAQAGYSLSTARRILSVRRRTSSIDTPLNELSRDEYYDLPTKSGIGTPVSWYFDPQRSSRTLYVWPTPSVTVAANTTLQYTYQRVIEDVDALDNDIDVPQEWLEALAYNLADRLMLQFGVDDVRITRRAEILLAEMTADSQETASVYFQP